MFAHSLILAVVVAAQSSAQAPPRDPRLTGRPSDPVATAILQIQQLTDRGEIDRAETILNAARAANPRSVSLLQEAVSFYNRTEDFGKTMEALETIERLSPRDRQAAQRVATFYWEKAFRDRRLDDETKSRYIKAGIAATDRALAIDANYIEALTYKNILLRLQANMEADRFVQQQLIAEADELRARAMALQREQSSPGPAATAPVRVGGNIAPPAKIKDVRPVYPADALTAGIQGVVICEATVGIDGRITDAQVLRSVPGLDAAALDAVRQWEFTPTLLNGRPVPVIMTVTVNFTLQ